MKPIDVAFSAEATRDMIDLGIYLSGVAGQAVAEGYIARLQAYCLGFGVAPMRGMRRDDVRKGLRIIGFERRVTLLFSVSQRQVLFLRILYGGQDWQRQFR